LGALANCSNGCGPKLLGNWCSQNGYGVAGGNFFGPNGSYYDANLQFVSGNSCGAGGAGMYRGAIGYNGGMVAKGPNGVVVAGPRGRVAYGGGW
jgi:hypothetical protein